MDAVARSRRVLLSGATSAGASLLGRFLGGSRGFLGAACAGLVCLLCACAGKKTEPAVGMSDPRLGARSVDAGADAGPSVSPELASYKTTMQKLTPARVPSVGHASGRWDIDVWCNESGCDALTKGAVPKEGATYAVEHTERAATPIPGPTYFMEKKAPGYSPSHGDFRYVVVGARGGLVFDGPGGMCADCHDEAPRERLFPVGVVRP